MTSVPSAGIHENVREHEEEFRKSGRGRRTRTGSRMDERRMNMAEEFCLRGRDRQSGARCASRSRPSSRCRLRGKRCRSCMAPKAASPQPFLASLQGADFLRLFVDDRDAAVFGGLRYDRWPRQHLHVQAEVAVSTTCMAEVIGDDCNAFIKTAKEKGSVPQELTFPSRTPPLSSRQPHHRLRQRDERHRGTARRDRAGAERVPNEKSTSSAASTATRSAIARSSASLIRCRSTMSHPWPTATSGIRRPMASSACMMRH